MCVREENIFFTDAQPTLIEFDCLAEQWVRNADSRVCMPSCQLADLSSMPGAEVDDINECILLEGAQDGIGMRVGGGVHDDVTSTTCIHSVALRRFAAEAPKGTRIRLNAHYMLIKIMNHKSATSQMNAGRTPMCIRSIPVPRCCVYP